MKKKNKTFFLIYTDLVSDPLFKTISDYNIWLNLYEFFFYIISLLPHYFKHYKLEFPPTIFLQILLSPLIDNTLFSPFLSFLFHSLAINVQITTSSKKKSKIKRYMTLKYHYRLFSSKIQLIEHFH